MFWNNFISYMQLLAFPVFTVVLTVATIVVAVALVRFLRAARRLANARRRLLEAEIATAEPRMRDLSHRGPTRESTTTARREAFDVGTELSGNGSPDASGS